MRRLEGIGYAVLSSATFGLIPLFSIPLMNEGMGTNMVIFYRLLFAAVIMGISGLIQKRSFKVDRQHWLSLLGFGSLYIFTASVLLLSYHYIDSGVATTIHFLYPIVVTLIMVMFFDEKLTLTIIVSALLSVGGVALLCIGSGDSINLKGVLIALTTSFSYAFYIIRVNSSKAARIDAVIFTFYVLLSGAIVIFILSLFTQGIQTIPSSWSWLNLLLLALLSTVVSNFALVKAVKLVGSTITSILGSMEPLTALTVGVFVFGEAFGVRSFAGILLVLISVYLVVKRSK
jgi:Predicted permeases